MEAYLVSIAIGIFLKFVSQTGARISWDQVIAEVDKKIRDLIWDPIEGPFVAIANGVIEALRSVLTSADSLNAISSKIANKDYAGAVTLVEDALKGSAHDHAEAALNGTQVLAAHLAPQESESTIPDDNGQPAGEQSEPVSATDTAPSQKSKRGKRSA